VFPELGHRAIADLNAPDFLMMLRKVESHRPYTAIRLREMCSQVCRYAVATGRAIRNPVADLAGALQRPPVTHRPAITDRREFAKFLRDFSSASMNPITRAAARFAMLTFVRAQEFHYAMWEEIDWSEAQLRVPPSTRWDIRGGNVLMDSAPRRESSCPSRVGARVRWSANSITKKRTRYELPTHVPNNPLNGGALDEMEVGAPVVPLRGRAA
jgi:integrase